ncbi:transcriptional regulator [Pseudoclavibacter endophyticus]|nr:TetR/AcrR family transcriptional regulator [Pseudoclavibacter endophyticus]GGA72291.1 transcriptional regulator [Pseudoclavibacter endophyticus]
MPKIVDHEQRRADIISGLLRVVARDGIDAATTRALAKELGVATGSLWHYFSNFDTLVAEATARVIDLVSTRIAERTTNVRGMAKFDAIMTELLPLDDVTRNEAVIIVNLWGRLSTRTVYFEWVGTIETWWEDLRAAMCEAVEDGELVPETPVEELVQVFAAITHGQQVAHAAIPETPPEAHEAIVRTVLAPWRA